MSNFTYSHYRKTLQEYFRSGYKVTDFSQPIEGKQLILRHDIDMDLELVEGMSKIEKEVDATSIYFIRLHAKNYNALSLPSVRIMQTIASRGQEIGLHYEPTFTKDEDHKAHILESIYLMEKITDLPIRYFSLHEPARSGVDITQILPEINRSYGAPFYNNFKYLSDSSARWREGCFSEHLNKWQKLIVLTHPFWWYENISGENY